MPGNKKNRRVGKDRRSAHQRAEDSKWTRAREIAVNEDRIRRITNGLPLGHPEHAHKIELVFGAIEGYLTDMEQTGESLVTARGEAAVRDPLDQTLIPAAQAFISQHTMFTALAERFGWGPVPDGLRRMGAKLGADMMLFASDMADARTTLTWMRTHIVTITPHEWSETYEHLVAQEDQAERREAERRKHA
jgi:hypothetical protein